MKPAAISTGLILATAVPQKMLLPCEAFEVNPPEVISHTLLARLILESPSRIATRQKKSGMAFLADSAVENAWSDSSKETKSPSQGQPKDDSPTVDEKGTEVSSS
eukprot:scaffold1000_cov166-Amphora_coffeaeformis.AAC.29